MSPRLFSPAIAAIACAWLALPGLRAQEPTPSPTPGLSVEAAELIRQGLGFFQLEDLKKARDAFAKAVALAPDRPAALVNLATVEYRMGELDAARTHLEKAVHIDPDSAQPWTTLGVVCYEQGAYDHSLAALARAVVLDPANARAHNFLGVTLGAKGWLLGAEAELRKSVELDPNHAGANFNLALAYLQRTPPAIELARRHYQEALRLGAAPDPLVEKKLGKP